MIERGKGWLPDDEDVVAEQLVSLHVSHLVGVAAPAPIGDIDYTTLLTRRPDQGSTSSCVGQALSISIWLIAKALGIDIPWPSAKGIYDFARAEDQPYMRFVDAGCRPLAAAAVVTQKGVVAEADWPIVFARDGSTNINVRPPIDIFQTALAFLVGAYYRIPSGPGAAALVDLALANGKMPIFAMPVDEAYEKLNTGAVYEGRAGKSLGGHMQCIAGRGDGFKRIVSSWGVSHGDNGIVKISNSYIDSGECTDIIVPTIVPRLETEG